MKRLITIILSALLILTALALTSCDQESVDNALDNLINTGKDLLDPFFRVAESSSSANNSADADVAPDVESTRNSTPGGDSTADIEGENDSTTDVGGDSSNDLEAEI